MSDDLDVIRAFRAEDGLVDATAQERARVALFEHIAGSDTGKRGARRRSLGRRVVVGRIRADMIAVALASLVVIAVCAALLSIGSNRPQRPAHHAVVEPQGSLVIRNFAPSRPPALPGRTVCTAELTRAGAPPGGVFYLAVCQFQSPGAGGSPSGTFHANSGKVDGVNQYPFSITASGLRPNTGGSVYAVWLLQAAPRGGRTGTFRLLRPHRPRLLGLIEPGVGQGGKLAAEGMVPPDLLGDDDLLLITLQPHGSTTRPGRTVLHGFVSLPNTGS